MGAVLLRGIPGIELAPPADEVDQAVADALLRVPLPSALVEFLSVSNGARLGRVEIFDLERITTVTNAPGPGKSVQVQWAEACNEVALADVRDRIRQAPLSEAITGQDRWVVDEEFTVGACVRIHAFPALVAKARDEMLAHATGGEVLSSAVGRLAQVYLAGHVPVGLSAAR